VRAQYELGLTYDITFVEEDYTQALYWHRKAALQGYAQPEYKLGYLYYEAYGVEKDLKEAAFWFRKAADHGHPGAISKLGLMYYDGEYFAQNKHEAVRWHLAGAAKNDHQSKIDLEEMQFTEQKQVRCCISE